MTKPVRIRDIAEACGVSVGAVSAPKGQPGLREDTRLRIISVAQQQGYDFSRLRTDKIKRVLFCFTASTISAGHCRFILNYCWG